VGIILTVLFVWQHVIGGWDDKDRTEIPPASGQSVVDFWRRIHRVFKVQHLMTVVYRNSPYEADNSNNAGVE
jgi:hypothetical protein